MKWISLVLLVGVASAQHCPKIEIDSPVAFAPCPIPLSRRVKWTPPSRASRTTTALEMSRTPRKMRSSGPTDTLRALLWNR
jgi:hypothetical protein